MLDINVCVPGIDEPAVMREVVMTVSQAYDVPLCLDSPNPQTLAVGLAAAPERPLVNSVNGEEKALQAILPVVAEFWVTAIGLVIDDDGVSMDPRKRLSIAAKIIDRAGLLSIPIEDRFAWKRVWVSDGRPNHRIQTLTGDRIGFCQKKQTGQLGTNFLVQ